MRKTDQEIRNEIDRKKRENTRTEQHIKTLEEQERVRKQSADISARERRAKHPILTAARDQLAENIRKKTNPTNEELKQRTERQRLRNKLIEEQNRGRRISTAVYQSEPLKSTTKRNRVENTYKADYDLSGMNDLFEASGSSAKKKGKNPPKKDSFDFGGLF
jgi:hypothetical protein